MNMKLSPRVVDILDRAIMATVTTAIGVCIAAVLITAFKVNVVNNPAASYHINFCDDKEPGKVYIWENYKYHDKKLDEFQSNNNVEIVSISEDDEIFSYHVKCLTPGE